MKNKPMDQKQMDHLRHINREILQQKNRLQKLRALQQGRVRQAPGLPSLTPQDAQGRYAAQLRELEESTARHLEKCLEEAQALQDFIQGVEDSQTRQLLSLRYLECLTWQQVAFRMGYCDEQTPSKQSQAFFKRQQKEVKAGVAQK